MGFFGSSKTSKTTSNQYDQRQVVGEGGYLADDGAFLSVANSTNTNNYTSNVVTDGGAFHLVDGVVSNSVGALADTAARSMSLADVVTSNALGAVGNAYGGALSRSLSFADGLSSNAFGMVSDSNARSLSFVDGALSQVLGVVGDAMNAVKGGVSAVTSAAQSSASMAKDAYADAKGRGAMTDYLILAALGAAAIVAVAALRKS